MDYIEYLRAEALMQRGDYVPPSPPTSVSLKGYKSQSYRKTPITRSGFYITSPAIITGEARKNFDIARKNGQKPPTRTRRCAAMLEETTAPNPKY